MRQLSILLLLIFLTTNHPIIGAHLNQPEPEARSAAFAHTTHMVRTMANSPGARGAFFKTKVDIYNPTPFAYSIYATLYDHAGKVETRSIRIEANETLTFENFLDEVFEYRGAGAVQFNSVDPPGGSGDFHFSVYAEVYTDSSNGRYSTVVAGHGTTSWFAGYTDISADANRPKRTVVSPGITVNSRQRVNIGLWNWETSSRTYLGVVRDRAGNTAAR